MEDKKSNNLDDELKSGASEDSQEDADDFGLPEASADDDRDTGEEPGADEGSYGEESDIFEDEVTSGEEIDDSNVYRYHSTHDDDRQRNPVGLIISFVLIGVIVIAIAIYWFFFREPVPKPVAERPATEEVEPPVIVEEEEPEAPVNEAPDNLSETPPPVEDEPDLVEEGAFSAINQPTGRYYIVLNSFIDGDLAEDYAQNLAGEGVDTRIIPPNEPKKGFHRVVLSNEYSSWQAAEANIGEFKEVFGESIWVLRY